MTKEEIKALTEEQVEARAAELAEAAKADGADLEAIEAETLALEERRAQLIEQRKADAAAVAAGAGEVIEKREEKKRMKTIEEIRSSREYEEAYANYIKTGDKHELRNIVTSVGIGNAGEDAFPVPYYLEQRIETSWNDSRLWSAIRRKTSIKGIVRVPIEMTADPAVVHDENTDRPAEENITFAEVTITPKMIKKWVQITDELLSLSGREFLDYIYDEIEYQIIQAVEKNVLQAILASAQQRPGTLLLSATVNAEAISATTILQALATLADGARNPVAIMNKSTFYEFMALEDLQKRPIFNVISENGRPVYSINGVEVIFADANGIMDSEIPGTKLIFVGDLDGLVVNLPNGDGVDVVYDPYTKAPDDMVVITGKMLMGAEVVKKNFFCGVPVVPPLIDGGNGDGN